MNWTEEQLAEYQARRGRGIDSGGTSEPEQTKTADEPEKRLQAKIEAYLTEHGFYWFHDRSRGCNQRGFPDLVAALPNGRTVWLELKSAGGRMSDEQRMVGAKLAFLGHGFYEIRSYRRFLEIMEGRK